jgi:hypothetical protein
VPPAAAIAVAAALAGLALARRREAARAPAAAAGLSLLAIVLGWAPFVPGEAKYVPAAPGIYDRVNIVVAFGAAALVVSLAALAGALARGRARVVLPALIVAAVAAGWTVRARDDVADYARAASAQRGELATVARAVPRPAPGTVLVVFHRSTWAARGVPVFGQPWDLGPALQLRFGDRSLSGFPAAPSASSTATTSAAATTTTRPGR